MFNTQVKLTTAQQLWVDALRSGKFSQTDGTLQAGDAFCCLGVACVIAKEQGIAVGLNTEGQVFGGTLASQRPVWDWLGLKDHMGRFENPEFLEQLRQSERPIYEELKLTKLNDIAKYSFSQIADVIEQNAGALFIQPEGNTNV